MEKNKQDFIAFEYSIPIVASPDLHDIKKGIPFFKSGIPFAFRTKLKLTK